MARKRVLAIDPGSRLMGFAVLEADGRRIRAVASGAVDVDGTRRRRLTEAADRLRRIFDAVTRLAQRHRAHELAVEAVFVGPSPKSALRLAEARAAAILAAARRRMNVREYAASEARAVLTGWGAASKPQVALAVARALALRCPPDPDAADALAIGLCHAARTWRIEPWRNR
jgi:crossover junction endodeoxyribonuclease RuvC